MTPDQRRRARELLVWNLQRLAVRVFLGTKTLVAFEAGGNTRHDTRGSLRKAFQKAGIEILNGATPVVRLRPDSID